MGSRLSTKLEEAKINASVLFPHSSQCFESNPVAPHLLLTYPLFQTTDKVTINWLLKSMYNQHSKSCHIQSVPVPALTSKNLKVTLLIQPEASRLLPYHVESPYCCLSSLEYITKVPWDSEVTLVPMPFSPHPTDLKKLNVNISHNPQQLLIIK